MWDILLLILGFLTDYPIVILIIFALVVAESIFTGKIWKFFTKRSFGLLLCLFVICFMAFAEVFQDYLLPLIRKIYALIGNQIYYVNIFDDGFRNVSLSIGGSITLSIAVLGVILTLIRSTLNRQQNNTDVQRLITEQISRAVEQTGAYKQEVDGENYQPNIEARLGGLYSLQRIMQESPKDAQTIARIFYAYVRENTKRVKSIQLNATDKDGKEIYQLPEDIKAAVSIIGRFSKKILLDSQLNFSRADFKRYYLVGIDFSYNNLENVDLSDTDFTEANLSNANLSGAILAGTVMTRANLSYVNLSNTDLTETILDDVDSYGPHLSRTNFMRANLSGADLNQQELSSANLSRANLRDADLSGAILFSTNLRNADLRGANLFGVNLRETDLSNANLSSARNLDQEEIERAKLNWRTKLPDYIIRPNFWKKKTPPMNK